MNVEEVFRIFKQFNSDLNPEELVKLEAQLGKELGARKMPTALKRHSF